MLQQPIDVWNEIELLEGIALAYAPTSNNEAKRIVGALKAAVRTTGLEIGVKYDIALRRVLLGYRRHSFRDEVSPFEQVPAHNGSLRRKRTTIVFISSEYHCRVQLLA